MSSSNPTRTNRRFMAAAVAGLLCLVGGMVGAQTTPVGGIARQFTLTNRATQQPLRLTDFAGKILVLDFFAYWCGPCQASSPDVETNIQEYYAARGGNAFGVPVQVLAVNVEPQNPALTDAFVENAGLELAADDPMTSAGAYSQFSTGGIPLFVIINCVAGSPSHSQYQVIYRQAGYAGAPALRSVIDQVRGPAIPEITVEQPAGAALTDGSGGIAFGSVNIGSAGVVKTFTIRNTGTGELGGIAVSKDGANAADFTLNTNGMASTLAVGASTSFTVTFQPTGAGARSAAVHIGSNDADENPFDISLTGTGTLPPAPEISVEQPAGTVLADGGTALSFGGSDLGVAVGTRIFTIRNTGNADLTGLTVAKSGSHAGDFTLDTGGMATSLVPGSSTTFAVTFTPGGSGLRTAALQIANNDADENPFDIAVAGTGYGVPTIAVQYPAGTALADGSGSIVFGAVNVGASSGTKVFTVRNGGSSELTGLTVTKDGSDSADFTVNTGAMSNSLAAGASTTFAVTFTPGSTGPRLAALHVAADGGRANPFDITVAGTGISGAEIAVDHPAGTGLLDGGLPVACGTAGIGSPGTAKTFTIRNTGTMNLTGIVVSNSGLHAGDFTLDTSGTAAVLAPGTSTTFTVTFTPGAVGARSTFIRIASNDADENPFDIALTGTGVEEPEIVVEQPEGQPLVDGGAGVCFGSVEIGASGVAKTFTVRNTGAASLTGILVTKAGANAGDFSLDTSGMATSLAPGSTTTFVVRFEPTTAGVRTAVATIKSSDADEATFDIVLTGTGSALPRIVVEHSSGEALADGTSVVATGNVGTGTTGAPVIFRIRNTGTADLSGLSVSKDGPDAADFLVDTGAMAASLAPGADTTFAVVFAPQIPGPRSATIHVGSNDAESNPFDIALSGNAVAVPEIVVEQPSGTGLTDGAATVSFGTVNAGDPNPVRIFTVRNVGTAELGGLMLTKDGPDASSFLVNSAGMPGSLPPGGSATFSVTFAPALAGVRMAAIHLASNDSNETSFDIVLAGTAGLLPDIAIESPKGVSITSGGTRMFGNVILKKKVSTSFLVRNVGAANLVDTTVGLVGPNASEFKVTANVAGPIKAGKSKTFSVQFAPTSAGAKTAQLRITSNDPDESPYLVNLTGTATAGRSLPDTRLAMDGKPAAGQSDIAGLDSDGDGYLDEAEAEFGTDPLSANSIPGFHARVVSDRVADRIELRFISQPGMSYVVESSTDLESWNPVEARIKGTGGTISRFYSIQEVPHRWFVRVARE